jgi:hypothetical protein
MTAGFTAARDERTRHPSGSRSHIRAEHKIQAIQKPGFLSRGV